MSNPTPTYLKIYDDFWPTRSGAIFHQFAWQVFAFNTFYKSNLLEYVKDMKIPLDRTLIGTEPLPGAPVYGYNNDGSLNLSGGKNKRRIIRYMLEQNLI